MILWARCSQCAGGGQKNSGQEELKCDVISNVTIDEEGTQLQCLQRCTMTLVISNKWLCVVHAVRSQICSCSRLNQYGSCDQYGR